jgi:branched-chain amino acid transport system permease protein
MTTFLQLLLIGVMVGMVYAIVGVGFVLLWKTSKVLNFAQGALTMGGAFITYYLIYDYGIPKWGAILSALAVAVVVALIIERFTIRPMIGQPLWAPILMLLGLAAVVKGVLFLVFSSGAMVPKPDQYLLPTGHFHLGDIVISKAYLVAFGICICLFVSLGLFFRYSKLGLGMRALAEDQQVAQSLGIKVKNLLPIVWIMAVLLATIAGIIMGTLYRISPDLEMIALLALPAVLLGGMESFLGLLIAGPIVGITQNLSAYYLVPRLGTGVDVVIPYVLMFIIVLIRPWGIFGLKEIERV